MKTIKAVATAGFTYRSGYGKLSVINITPNKKRATYKTLYMAPRIFAPGEQITVVIDDYNYAIYLPPEPKAERRVRPSYVSVRRRKDK